MRQRYYFNGKLLRSSSGDVVKLRKWLDNVEKEWRGRGLSRYTESGAIDMNEAVSIERVSPDELLITTTADHKIRIVNV